MNGLTKAGDPAVLGVWLPERLGLRDGLLMHARRPNSGLPSGATDLENGQWTPGENGLFATCAEVAEVRWLHVDRVSCGRGAEIARKLRAMGYCALAFMDQQGRVPGELPETLEGLVCWEDIAVGLEGRIYAAPVPDWSRERAVAVSRDIQAEMESGGAISTPARDQVFDRAEEVQREGGRAAS